MKDALHQEIAKLRRQLDEANETIRQMRETLDGNDFTFAGVAGLSATEARYVAQFVRRGRVGRQQLYDALYGMSLDQPDEKTLDVYIYKVRKKLRPYGIVLKTIWDAGWVMDADSVAKLRTLAGLPAVSAPPLVPAQAQEAA